MSAKEFIESGSELFVSDEYEEACVEFTKAIEMDGVDGSVKYDALCRRSNAYIKLNNFMQALTDGSDAVKLDDSRAMGYLRKAIALHGLGEYETGLTALKTGSSRLASSSHAADKKLTKQFALWEKKLNLALGLDETSQQQQQLHEDKSPATAPTPAAAQPAASAAAPTPAAAAVHAAAAAAAAAAGPKPVRQEWFQSNEFVTVEVFVKKLKKDNVDISFSARSLNVNLKNNDGDEVYSKTFELADEIIPPSCSIEILSTKVEIKLKKRTALPWASLEAGSTSSSTVSQGQSVAAGAKKPPPAYASKKNWDAIAAGVEDEKPEGDEALNSLFRQIYKDGTDEQRKAMVKSFQESGGTTLSTNWDDIGKRQVKVQPPKGMVAKDWNSHEVVAEGTGELED